MQIQLKILAIQYNNDILNINNQGYFDHIKAFLLTPNEDIAHIYESDNNKNNSVNDRI